MIRGIIIKVENGAVRVFSADGRSEGEFANREFLQHYGVSSRPLPGAENIILGAGNFFVSIADGDRRYQIDLEEGEVALHDDLGQKVHLTREGIVIEGQHRLTASMPEINLGGDRETLRALIDERILALINAHVHPVAGDKTAPPVVPILPIDVCTVVTKAT